MLIESINIGGLGPHIFVIRFDPGIGHPKPRVKT